MHCGSLFDRVRFLHAAGYWIAPPVDGRRRKPLPVVIASTTSDQTLVTGGNAVLGEAIATGSYTLSLRHATGTTSQTSEISGTTNFVANGSRVTATIDLGVALGQHIYTFGL